MSIKYFIAAKVEKFPEPLSGTVEQAIAHNHSGRVKCLGSSWPAKFYQPDCLTTVVPNQPVSIVAMQGITLLVMPEDDLRK